MKKTIKSDILSALADSSKKHILIFSKRTLHDAPRVIREIEVLKDDFIIFSLGETKPTDGTVIHENIYTQRSLFDIVYNRIKGILFRLNIVRHYISRFSRIDQFIIKNKISIIIIHEPVFLPLAVRLKKKYNIKIVFNAHEYHPLEFEDQPGWLESTGSVYDKLYRDYLSKLDLMINVCDGIAEKCLTEYNVESIVIPNAAFYSKIPIFERTEDKIKIIYHGAILESRKIEEMIKVAELLGENYVFDIMGTSLDYNNIYYQKLLKNISNLSNVSFKKSVLFDEIIPTINKYDIGLFLLPPSNFNYEYALPNKIFEYIQAKLAIAISPSKEMRHIVEKYNLGVVADDFSPESLAKKIKELSKDDIFRFKQKSEIASKVENAEKYSELYLSHIKMLLNDSFLFR